MSTLLFFYDVRHLHRRSSLEPRATQKASLMQTRTPAGAAPGSPSTRARRLDVALVQLRRDRPRRLAGPAPPATAAAPSALATRLVAVLHASLALRPPSLTPWAFLAAKASLVRWGDQSALFLSQRGRKDAT